MKSTLSTPDHSSRGQKCGVLDDMRDCMHLCPQREKGRERGRNNTLGTDLLSRSSLPSILCAPWPVISPGGQDHCAYASMMLLPLQLLLVSYSDVINVSTVAKPVLYFICFFC